MTVGYGTWGAYNDILAGPPEADFFDYIERLAPAPARILELGVGSGRLAIPLARAGYDVVGIDASREMLDLLRASDPYGSVHLFRGDFSSREVEQCGTGFDLVLLAYNALSMQPSIDAQRATLDNAATSLRPGGNLVIENASAHAVLSQINERNQAMGVRFVDDNAWLYLARYIPETDRYLARFLAFEATGIVERSADLTLISVERLVEFARESGLECVHVAEAWDGTAFTDASDQYVVTLQRSCPPPSQLAAGR